MAGALDRYTVLDLSRVRSGPSAVRQLTDWGANVIQIEAPLTVEPGDGMGGPRHAGDFQNLHRGKRSLTLDFKRPEAKEIMRRLVEKADVAIENFRPDVKHRLGIDYETFRAINPRIVYASISGFGQTGPYALRPGFDQIAQGMGGMMSVTGLPGQGPVRAGSPIADLSTGLFAAFGILAALLEREKSGEGQWIQTSLLQSQIAMMDFQAARYLREGEVAGQLGNEHPMTAPMGVYPTADGFLNIAAAGDRVWFRICDVFGLEDLKTDPELRGDPGRARNRVRINAAVTEALKDGTTDDWVVKLNDAGVPCGPIYTMDQVFADPQVKHLQVAQTVHHAKIGDFEVVGQPILASRTPATLDRAAPDRGEHTGEILRSVGYTDAEVASLREANVV